VRAAQIFFIAN